MPKIVLKDVEENIIIEKEFHNLQTITDVKIYIREHFNQQNDINTLVDTTNIQQQYILTNENNEEIPIKILYRGKIINENTVLEALCEEKNEEIQKTLMLHFVLAKNKEKNDKENNLEKDADDVQMKSIDDSMKIKIMQNGKELLVDPQNIIKVNGKSYLIKKRIKRVTVREEIRSVMLKLQMNAIIKVSVIIALWVTKNKKLAMLLTIISCLRFSSLLKSKIEMKTGNIMEKSGKTLLAFFMTMFFINGEQLLQH